MPFIKRFIGTIEALNGLPKFIEDQTADSARVAHELTDNHGSSLKDAIKRTESKLDAHIAICIAREEEQEKDNG